MNKGEKKLLKVMMGFLIVVSMGSLLYYLMMVSYAGWGVSFGWFWISTSFLCILLTGAMMFIVKKEVLLPRPVKVMMISVVTLGLVCFMLIEGILLYYGNKQPSKEADYLIILGAQVRGTRITRALQSRLDAAVIYIEENEHTKVIVSGGQGPGEDISEAKAMEVYLLEKGISEDRIYKEDHSTNTYENIKYSKEMIKEKNKKIVIVSNDFHIFRAVHIGKKQKIGKLEGLGAPTGDILSLSYYIREALAVGKDFLAGNL